METKEEKNSNGWYVTAERFVAFIDIMGFKDMVLKNSHDAIYKMMLKIDAAKNENEELFSQSSGGKMVTTVAFSDSIIIYSKDNTLASISAVIATIAGITSDLFIHSIPHKGSVAFGKMTLNNKRSIFFGQPLIDAYLLQEELNFYGIAVHATVEKLIVDLKYREVEEETFLTDYYPCALKTCIAKHLTVFPIFADEPTNDYAQQIYNSVAQMRYYTSGHLRKYIDNTEDYFKYIKENMLRKK